MRKRFLIALLAVVGVCVGVYTLKKSSAARIVAPRMLAERWLAAVAGSRLRIAHLPLAGGGC